MSGVGLQAEAADLYNRAERLLAGRAFGWLRYNDLAQVLMLLLAGDQAREFRTFWEKLGHYLATPEHATGAKGEAREAVFRAFEEYLSRAKA